MADAYVRPYLDSSVYIAAIKGAAALDERQAAVTTFVSMGQLTEAVLALYDHINERMQAMTDATQADIDALTTQVGQVATDLATAQTTLQAEIDALAGAGVDVSGLQAAVAPLDAAVVALGGLTPTPPPAP